MDGGPQSKLLKGLNGQWHHMQLKRAPRPPFLGVLNHGTDEIFLSHIGEEQYEKSLTPKYCEKKGLYFLSSLLPSL